ncbi:MAG: MGMT family protein [Candidatus Micrarchaeota archaeon]|nr:MGMT family protein [Candidatus Micrarchaeota archaeon]
MNSFSARVLDLVKRVPRGRVTTYAEIARAAGSPRAARAAGNALNKNPRPVRVPCHRVVSSGGKIGGYSRGVAIKTSLLRREDVFAKGGRIAGFEKLFFRFNKTA